MKKKITIISAILIVCGSCYFLLSHLSKTIGVAHTTFAFDQVKKENEKKPKTFKKIEELAKVLRELNIDWNSCQLTESTIWDSWGTECVLKHFGEQQILISAGPDKVFETSDDIKTEI